MKINQNSTHYDERGRTNILNEQNTRFDFFFCHYTNNTRKTLFKFIGKIKRLFVFSEEMFNLEILSHEQILHVTSHLLESIIPNGPNDEGSATEA